jgi:hypothetical protein
MYVEAQPTTYNIGKMCLAQGKKGKIEFGLTIACLKKSRESYDQKPSFEAFYVYVSESVKDVRSVLSFKGMAPLVNNYGNRAFEGCASILKCKKFIGSTEIY